MDWLIKAQAIEMFIAQYGVSPEKFGYPAIGVCSQRSLFLFGKNDEVVEAYQTAVKLNAFFERAYQMPVLIVILIVTQSIGMFLFPNFAPYFNDCILFLLFLSLCWGGWMYFMWRKFVKARVISRSTVIEIAY